LVVRGGFRRLAMEGGGGGLSRGFFGGQGRGGRKKKWSRARGARGRGCPVARKPFWQRMMRGRGPLAGGDEDGWPCFPSPGGWGCG